MWSFLLVNVPTKVHIMSKLQCQKLTAKKLKKKKIRYNFSSSSLLQKRLIIFSSNLCREGVLRGFHISNVFYKKHYEKEHILCGKMSECNLKRGANG